MSSLHLKEVVNAGWLVLCICLVGIFLIFLVKEMKYDGWFAKLRNQAAIALAIYFLGETLTRGRAAVLLYRMVDARDIVLSFGLQEKIPITMIGASLSFIGALLCVRAFTPSSWGHRAWVIIGAIAVAAMVITYIVH